MMKVLEVFERIITVVLLLVMMLAILLATVDVGIQVVEQLFEKPFLLLEVDKVSNIFGFVFMVLIGLELLETVKTYLSSEQLHVEVVFLVAMIAIARKVILLDVKHLDAPILYGIAAIILALASGFFFLRLAYRQGEDVRNPSDAREG
ncbi:MAG: phosphate-starvation-inducible PsiE family protein [Planctomycetes bacterium]|nr:phosphate-starvation-inducible PsiE family protein [Planctomycetota bacterium]